MTSFGILSKMRFAVSLILLLTSVSQVSAYTIKGKIIDAAGEAMADASVRLLSAKDSTFVKGRMADSKGSFTLTDVNSGEYIIETSFIGYDKAYSNVEVKKKNIEVEDIRMYETSHLLAETTVTGVKAPIVVKEDTVEFNAGSYKTPPNAVIEDLLKRLPGVEVGSDGKITANGKEIKKILVDGKEFFTDDPKVASKNLPANLVERLQVIDQKSELARMTGVDDGEEETVINLTVKKGMKNGWFGNAEAGYGTDNRYIGSFNVNRFWDGNQITLLGNANNTNNLGFTDGNSGRFNRYGGDNGINTSQSIGLNFNVGRGDTIRVGGNAHYSHSNKVTRRRQNRQYLLEKDSYTQNSANDTEDGGHNISANFRVEWKPDSFNSLDFRPQFSYHVNNSNSNVISVSQGRNLSLNRSNSEGQSYNVSGRLIYNHNFKRVRGRSFSISADYRFSNTIEDEQSYVYNLFYQLLDQNGNDSIDVYDQYIDSRRWTNSLNARVSWTEPLGPAANGNFLTISYNAQANWNNSDRIVYERPVTLSTDFWEYDLGGNHYELPIPVVDYTQIEMVDSLSNQFRNSTFQHDIRAGFKRIHKKYNLEAGVSVVPIQTQSINLTHSDKTIPKRTVWNFAPFATFRYKFAKQTSLTFRYNGRTSQPSMNQLQPVPDYSNPLNIREGNPNLVPTFTHRINLRHQHFDAETQRSVMSMLNVQVAQNSIISKTIFDNVTGGRRTTYENVNGIWSARLMNMFSLPFKNKLFSFNNNIFLNYNRRLGYNNGTMNKSNSLSVNESFSIAFRPENLEVELRPNYSFETTINSASNIKTTNVHRYGASFYASYTTPIDIIISTDLRFNGTKGYATGYDEDTWMWNASIAYQFLKEKNATIMLRAYDLLQQRKNISRSVTATYIDDTEYNALTRYFMLSFSYKFNTIGRGGSKEESRPEINGDYRPRGPRDSGTRPQGPPAGAPPQGAPRR